MKIIYELTRSTAKNKARRGGNEMISSNDRLDPHTKAELTKYLRELSTKTALEQFEKIGNVPYFSEEHPCHIGITICAPTNRRMDSPNWYPTIKALIDGLTDAGVFEDDNNKIITSMTFLPGETTDNKKYRIEIVIREGVDNSWRT